MKVLVDETVDVRLWRHLPGHSAFTVAYMGWKGLKNGSLLARAAGDGFDALITTDKNIEYQQNVQNLPCSVIVVHSASSSLRDLRPLIPALLKVLESLQRSSLVHVRP